MIELIGCNQIEKWNSIVDSFKQADVYYRCEYAISFMRNEEGTPFLLYFESNNSRLCYVIVEKDIADFSAFQGRLDRGVYFDWSSPYGYGGPISDTDFSLEEQIHFKEELFRLANSRNVVSQFIRFHPMIQNQTVCSAVIENEYIKDTVFIDLDTEDELMDQMDSKNRNLIRKAIKNEVKIIHDKGLLLDDFMEIYNKTMERDNARDFYFFPKEYYNYINENMNSVTEYFYAFKDEKMIAASIFFFSNYSMHYHLSGNLVESRTYAPTNLILYEAANWGRDIGMKRLHLGGGVGVEDSLFHFKKQFNKNGRISFYIGRNVFDEQKYMELMNVRKEINPDFDMDNSFYIQYRKPEV